MPPICIPHSRVFDDAGGAIDPNQVAVAEIAGARARADRAWHTEFACDDRAVGDGSADVDDDCCGYGHQRDPAGIGVGADQDVAVVDVGGAGAQPGYLADVAAFEGVEGNFDGRAKPCFGQRCP